MRTIVVRSGDHIGSIAFAHGAVGNEIWNHPKNRWLRDEGRRPNQLHPGDLVHIPTRKTQSFQLKPSQTNAFQAPVPKLHTRVQLLEGDRPVANQPFQLLGVHHSDVEGTSDADGWVSFDAPAWARTAVLDFHQHGLRLTIVLGALDPVTTDSGIRMRLILAGAFVGDERGPLNDPSISNAIQLFQEANDLDATGNVNDETRKKLVEIVGC